MLGPRRYHYRDTRSSASTIRASCKRVSCILLACMMQACCVQSACIASSRFDHARSALFIGRSVIGCSVHALSMLRSRVMRSIALVLVSIFVACGPTTLPPEGPHTEYPCGVHGRSCGNGMCCGEWDVCGHAGPFARCEPGYCCYDGPPNFPGNHAKTRQRPAN
jgi:hypothetical protein